MQTNNSSSSKGGGAQSGADYDYDCAVIGGGPGGLSAAIYMGRMNRSVVVLDDEEGRSTWHQINHNYLGFVDGIHATNLREIGEAQAARFGARFILERVEAIEYAGEGRQRRFTITTGERTLVARTIILATGVSDQFPSFEGSDECIGRTMFWCIICDGYEAIGRRIVVLGHNKRAASLALQLLNFTDQVTLVSWDEPFNIDDEIRANLKQYGIEIYDSICSIYNCSQGDISSVVLQDGTQLELDMLFVAQRMQPNTQLAEKLKIDLDEHGFIMADAEQKTNVEGIYAAGDCTRLFNHQVTSAVHEGGMAAAAANYYLYEPWQK